MSEMPNIKEALNRTGIRVTEFSKLVGVTNPMVYRWLDGSKAHALRIPRIAKLVATLSQLADVNALPLSNAIQGKKRLDTIKALIVKQLQKPAE